VLVYADTVEIADVVREVVGALAATGRRPLQDLQVLARGRVVILRGHVSSYFLKQMAQAAALTVPGVDNVWNELEVMAPR